MKNQKLYLLVAFIISGMLGFIVSWYVHHHSPAQSVKVIETFHYPALFVKQIKGDPAAGEKIFKEFCAACHASHPTIDLPAPRINDREQWRIIGKLGMDRLLKITITGVAAMPARGGCFECSDEQLSQAIKYILQYANKE